MAGFWEFKQRIAIDPEFAARCAATASAAELIALVRAEGFEIDPGPELTDEQLECAAGGKGRGELASLQEWYAVIFHRNHG